MNDAEFRRRAHALLTVTLKIAEPSGWLVQSERDELNALIAAGSAPELLPGGRMTCPVSGYAIRRRMPNEFGYGDNARFREYTVIPGAPLGFHTLDEALDFAASRGAEPPRGEPTP